jgi:hypothetical protein
MRSEIRLAFVAAAGAALMSGVVACSSGPSTSNQSTAAATGSSVSSAPSPGDRDAFMQCMTDNGVPAPPAGGPGGPPPDGAIPPPGLGGPQSGGTPPAPPGVDQQTWDNAMKACSSLAPAPPT